MKRNPTQKCSKLNSIHWNAKQIFSLNNRFLTSYIKSWGFLRREIIIDSFSSKLNTMLDIFGSICVRKFSGVRTFHNVKNFCIVFPENFFHFLSENFHTARIFSFNSFYFIKKFSFSTSLSSSQFYSFTLLKFFDSCFSSLNFLDKDFKWRLELMNI